MCGYSLEHKRQRPAKVGERLTTRRFDSGSIGLVDKVDSDCAVCMKEGTVAQLTNLPVAIVDAIGSTEAKATFTEQAGTGFAYTDGFRFANGRAFTLQSIGTNVGVEFLVVTAEHLMDAALADPAKFGPATEENTGAPADARARVTVGA